MPRPALAFFVSALLTGLAAAQSPGATGDLKGTWVWEVAGRNLAVLVEAAVRNFVLNLRGIDSTREFIERQAKLMEEG